MLVKRYDGPFLPNLFLTTHFIPSINVTLCSNGKQRLLKGKLEKVLVGRKSGTVGTTI